MNRFCTQYIHEVKLLFPAIGKEEKDYLHKLSVLLEEHCEEHPVNSVNDLYDEYDRPENVVKEYFSSMDTEKVIFRIKKARRVKSLILALTIALLMVATAATTKTVLYYKAYQETLDSLNGYWVEEIY